MLEVYKKQNGEYENKSIKLNDLGMNQSIEFTPMYFKEGEGQYGAWQKVEGIYHSEQGDIEKVVIWATKKLYDELYDKQSNKVSIKKEKPEGSKFHTYSVSAAGGDASTPSLVSPALVLTDVEKEVLTALMSSDMKDNLDAYIENFVKSAGTNESKAKQIFEKRNEL